MPEDLWGLTGGAAVARIKAVVGRYPVCRRGAPARMIAPEFFWRQQMNEQKPSAGILIVEDDPNVGSYLLRTLETSGYRVAMVGTAEDGLARAMSGAYDIILTDINLPGMAGLALLSKVKSMIPSCDVIVMTGDPSLENAVKSINEGAYDFLIKPFSIDTLFFTLKRCLEKRSLSAELQAVKAYREELASAYSQLKSLDRMKYAFLSTVAHEIRTPLTAIVMGMTFLEDGESGVIPPEIVAGMKKGAAKLEGTITELLAYASMQGEKEPANYEKVDVQEITAKAVSETSAKAAELGITVEEKYPSARAAVPGDADRLLLAVKSLIKNAILFNKPQGRVLVEVQDAPKSVNVRVEDTGAGIPAEHLRSIYDPFYQVADYITRTVGGLGLGLAVIKQVAESHKGRVTVSSEVGRGSVFTLMLPKQDCKL